MKSFLFHCLEICESNLITITTILCWFSEVDTTGCYVILLEINLNSLNIYYPILINWFEKHVKPFLVNLSWSYVRSALNKFPDYFCSGI